MTKAAESLMNISKSKRIFNAVLSQTCNFRSWAENKIYKEIINALHQFQEEMMFADALKDAVAKRQFLILEKLLLLSKNG